MRRLESDNGILTSPRPLPQWTLTRPPSSLFRQIAAADRTAIVDAVLADGADFQSPFERRLVDLGCTVGDVPGARLGEVRGHLDLAGQLRLVPLVAAENRQAVVFLTVRDHRPLRLLAEEHSRGGYQAGRFSRFGLVGPVDCDQSVGFFSGRFEMRREFLPIFVAAQHDQVGFINRSLRCR